MIVFMRDGGLDEGWWEEIGWLVDKVSKLIRDFWYVSPDNGTLKLTGNWLFVGI
ncbi:MAG TPA: hypothetical protein VKZ98_03800 [Aquaticitalea sp.]|nr:hypothetical protein [Aquaticitalea sp.]